MHAPSPPPPSPRTRLLALATLGGLSLWPCAAASDRSLGEVPVAAPPGAEPAPPVEPWEPLALEPLASTAILEWSLLDPAPESEPTLQLFPERYTTIPGVLTFRGGPFRSNAAEGRASMSEPRLELAWTFQTRASTPRAEGATHENWYGGAGWTGQPALVRWPAETRAAMNLRPELVQDDDFVEVIQGSLDGRVYFLDLRTGTPTRQPSFWDAHTQAYDASAIDVGDPIKGSVSIDPRGWPILYVGQGVAEHSEFAFRAYSLVDGRRLLYLQGWDPQAPRRWGGFDSSALVNRLTDTLFVGGENGLVYKVSLNTAWDPVAGTVELAPVIQRLRYRVPAAAGRKSGVENSLAAWRNLAWFGDSSGAVLAIDTTSMAPIWAWFGPEADDIDASIAVEIVGERPDLYLATEIEYQAALTHKAWVHRFDGLSGERVWSVGYDCAPRVETGRLDGGIYSTPTLGQGSLADRLFVSVTEIGGVQAGLLVALSKESGQELWRVPLPAHAWSTPLLIYDPQGRGYVLLADSGGDLTLWDGLSGQELSRLTLGAPFEASPAFMDDTIVLAGRGRKIFGVRLRR